MMSSAAGHPPRVDVNIFVQIGAVAMAENEDLILTCRDWNDPSTLGMQEPPRRILAAD
jgi:hypothetical protein